MFLRSVSNLVMCDIVSFNLVEWCRWVANVINCVVLSGILYGLVRCYLTGPDRSFIALSGLLCGPVRYYLYRAG